MNDGTPGERLRSLRKLHRFSHKQVHERWGISSCTLCRIERDEVLPDIPVAAKIAADVGMPITDWLTSPLVTLRVA